MPHVHRILLVIYSLNLEPLARFYERVLGLAVLERDEAFTVLGNDSVELALVRPSDVGRPPISSPPDLRADTPLKPSFVVDDLARAREAAIRAGGGAKPLSSAWLWRGQRHLDGYDPDGNIVQFRQVESAEG